MNGIKTKILTWWKANPQKGMKFIFVVIISNIFFFMIFSPRAAPRALGPLDLNPKLIAIQIPLKIFAQTSHHQAVHVSLLSPNHQLICQDAYIEAGLEEVEEKDSFTLTEASTHKSIPVYIIPSCYQKIMNALKKGMTLSAFPFIEDLHSLDVPPPHHKESSHEIIF